MITQIGEMVSYWLFTKVYAAPISSTGPLPNPLNCKDIGCALSKVIDFLLVIAVPILVIMVLWGGFQLMTAGGDEKKVTTGKHTLMWAVVGFAIVTIAYGVSGIVTSLLGGTP